MTPSTTIITVGLIFLALVIDVIATVFKDHGFAKTTKAIKAVSLITFIAAVSIVIISL